MDQGQEIQYQIKSWHDQAVREEITYKELESRIRKTSEVLNTKFAQGTITFDEYNVQRSYLMLSDASGQTWRLFTDDSWRQKTPAGKWEIGEPHLLLREKPLPDSRLSPPGSSRIPPVTLVIIVVLILLILIVVGLLLSGAFNISPTPAP